MLLVYGPSLIVYTTFSSCILRLFLRKETDVMWFVKHFVVRRVMNKLYRNVPHLVKGIADAIKGRVYWDKWFMLLFRICKWFSAYIVRQG